MSFYRRYLGIIDTPATLKQWLVIPENALATAVNGKVFQDPPGQFTAIRKTLENYYPEDVRIKKIAARCMTAGRAGQYNFPRCLRRNELYAANQSEMKFLEAALSLIFLLNKRYVPFYKWAHRAVMELPILGMVAFDIINKLLSTQKYNEKEEAIELLSFKIIEKLNQLGMSDSDSDFLPDHGPKVQAHIKDPEMRAYNVLAG